MSRRRRKQWLWHSPTRHIALTLTKHYNIQPSQHVDPEEPSAVYAVGPDVGPDVPRLQEGRLPMPDLRRPRLRGLLQPPLALHAEVLGNAPEHRKALHDADWSSFQRLLRPPPSSGAWSKLFDNFRSLQRHHGEGAGLHPHQETWHQWLLQAPQSRRKAMPDRQRKTRQPLQMHVGYQPRRHLQGACCFGNAGQAVRGGRRSTTCTGHNGGVYTSCKTSPARQTTIVSDTVKEQPAASCWLCCWTGAISAANIVCADALATLESTAVATKSRILYPSDYSCPPPLFSCATIVQGRPGHVGISVYTPRCSRVRLLLCGP